MKARPRKNHCLRTHYGQIQNAHNFLLVKTNTRFITKQIISLKSNESAEYLVKTSVFVFSSASSSEDVRCFVFIQFES